MGTNTFVEASDFSDVTNPKVGYFLTRQFLPEVSQDWDKVMTNGFLHRVPDGL